MRNLILFSVLVLGAGVSLAQVGEVSFANSGAPAAQAAFLHGLAQLHNFEYPDAADDFRKAESIDPGFVMAYWGEAMTHTHPVWMQQDADAGRAVLMKLGATPPERAGKAATERERLYLHAVEVLYGAGTKEERDFKFSDAMAAIHAKYPDDVDATAFYALSLLGTAHKGRDFAIYMRAAALLEEVFPTHQRHPGVVHYLIHCYDDPIHAPLGLRPARIYGALAPNAPHAIHMTSHIFIALGMWDEVIEANHHSTDVANQHRMDKSMPMNHCGHGNNWLEYGYLQEGRKEEARLLMEACRADALTEKYSQHDAPLASDSSQVNSYVAMRTFYVLDGGALDFDEPFKVPDDHGEWASYQFAYQAAIAAGLQPPSPAALAALHAAAARLHDAYAPLATLNSNQDGSGSAQQAVDIEEREIDALVLIRDGQTTKGLDQLRKTADAEKEMALEFGPPPVPKPAFELLGDELLAAGLPEEAETAYRASLARAPGRTSSLRGLFQAETTLHLADAAAETRARLEANLRNATAK